MSIKEIRSHLRRVLRLPPISELDTIRNLYKYLGAFIIAGLFGFYLSGLYHRVNSLVLGISDIISGVFTIFLGYFTLIQTQIHERNRFDNVSQLRLNAVRNNLENVYGPLYYMLHDDNRMDSVSGNYTLSISDLDEINYLFTKYAYVFPIDTYNLWYNSIRRIQPILKPSGKTILLLLKEYRTRLIQEYTDTSLEYETLIDVT